MKRSTTPKQSFFFEENPNTAYEEILITYWQGGKAVLEKTKEDLTFQEENDKIRVDFGAASE